MADPAHNHRESGEFRINLMPNEVWLVQRLIAFAPFKLPDREGIMRLRARLDRVSVAWRQHERAA